MNSPSPTPWRALPPVILISLLGNLTADAIKGTPPFLDWWGPAARSPSTEVKVLIAVVLLMLLCLTVYWLYRIRKAWRLPPHLLRQRPDGAARKVLVLGLSTPPKQVKGFDLGQGASIILYKEAAGDLLKIHSLKGALNDMQRHNWQQNLRAVTHHAQDTLELLIVVPSSGSGGSGHFTDQFTQWMKHYQGSKDWKDFDIEIFPAVDYEAFDALQGAYTAALSFAEKKGYKESDMVVDVTAGQKTTSIAAAMVTLTTDVDFQYIQTEAPFGAVTYSVVSEGPRDLG